MEYWIALLIPILAAAVIVLLAMRVASHSFQCKHCAGQFHIRWPRVLITVHSGSEYKLDGEIVTKETFDAWQAEHLPGEVTWYAPDGSVIPENR